MSRESTALSYVSGPSELPLLGQTIGDNLDATAARFGDREALVESASGRRWTYAEFVADVDRLARGLMARGLGVGDRIGIWSPNTLRTAPISLESPTGVEVPCGLR